MASGSGSKSFERLLVKAVQKSAFSLPDGYEQRLFEFWDLLCFWNKKINLTRITGTQEAVEKHFIDSLALLKAIKGAGSLLDVGSGAGFPGLVIAIVREDLKVHLVESVQKKAHFLKEVRRTLSLGNVTVHPIRLEQLDPKMRFDLVTGRAVSNVNLFANLVKGRIRSSGKLAVFIKGTEPPELNGYVLKDVWKYVLPFDKEKRAVAAYCLPAAND